MKLITITGLILLLASPAVAADNESWHLLTKSQGGILTLLKNLTKHECDFARARALGLPATVKELEEAKKRDEEERNKYRPSTGGGGTGGVWSSVVSEGFIVYAECFQ